MQRQSEREGFGRAYGSLKRKEKKRKWQTDGNLKKMSPDERDKKLILF